MSCSSIPGLVAAPCTAVICSACMFELTFTDQMENTRDAYYDWKDELFDGVPNTGIDVDPPVFDQAVMGGHRHPATS